MMERYHRSAMCEGQRRRHLCGTLMMEQGINLHLIAKRVGTQRSVRQVENKAFWRAAR